MRRAIFIFLLLSIPLFNYGQSITDLDFLIGSWDVSEVVFAGTLSEYVETGARECDYYLDGAYIKCETKGIRKGKERSYTFLFNYEKVNERFRLIKLSGDFDDYSIKSWIIDQESQVVMEEDLTGYQFVSDISFADKDRLVWRGWEPKIGENTQLRLIFTEVAIRR